MNTDRLEEFRALAHILNYSKTAEQLFLSQSILSRHIQELEQTLGVTLFLRGTHEVRLTDEGKYFLKWAEQLLEHVEHTMSALSGSGQGVEGTVRVMYSASVLNTGVMRFIRAFSQRYPEIALEFSAATEASQREHLYSVDLALSPCDYLDALSDDAEGALLGYQTPLLAIPPYHRFGDRSDIRPEDLRGEVLIVPLIEDLRGPYARNAMLAYRKCHGELRRIGAEDPGAALLMVELGKGVMFIPHHLKSSVYAMTRTLTVSDPECRFPIYLYWNRSRNNPAAELFFQRMKAEFQG